MPVTQTARTALWRSVNAQLHRFGHPAAIAGEMAGVDGSAESCAAAIVEIRRVQPGRVIRSVAQDQAVDAMQAEIARLRAELGDREADARAFADQCRDDIARLQAENARLRDALAPFAAVGQGYIEVGELVGDDCPTALGGIKVGHLRAAAKALGRS